jgi:zinc protease
LYGYYRRHYVPNNAIVVVVGDFETQVMLAQIAALFGYLPPGEPTPPVMRQEPRQKGERRLVVRGADQTPQLVVAYRAPAADHPDYFPLTLLNAALVGGSSLGMFGSGGSNKSSRLYRALVDTELVVDVSGSLVPTIDPFLYAISAVVRNGHELAEVEAALDAELSRLKTEPITQDELSKALKRAKAEFVLSGESITGQAQLLGMAEAVVGDYGWFETVLDKLTAVTLPDIERVRKTYLRKRNRVVVWHVPEGVKT